MIRLALIAKSGQSNFHSILQRISRWVAENGVDLYTAIDPSLLERGAPGVESGGDPHPHKTPAHIRFTPNDMESIAHADVVVTVGGDGTILLASQLMGRHPKPILGIHSGRLGFLAGIREHQVEEALRLVKEGRTYTDRREKLQAVLPDGRVFEALNEFLFTKKDTVSMIRLTATYDGMFVNEYWADGLIVSSPTGSTAYNLSSGGPIVLPGTDVMLLTPINPHSLTTRPLVLPSTRSLEVTVPESSEQILFSYDGFIESVTFDAKGVTISKSDTSIELIRLPGQDYFETLRSKLMWGADGRSTHSPT